MSQDCTLINVGVLERKREYDTVPRTPGAGQIRENQHVAARGITERLCKLEQMRMESEVSSVQRKMWD